MASMSCRVQFLNDIDPFSASTNFPEPSRPPQFSFNVNIPLINQIAGIHRILKAPHKLDDCTLQLYKEGDYGGYLDLDSTIDEQAEDFEDFHKGRNAIILRTQLSVRVHAIIEKLLSSTGRELRRALFSLKQIFQDDKDLVHEFVQNDGLACLVKVGSEADQNYQNYILRALGQVMLYVDGMNGVIEHIETIQWLYSLIASKYRLVVKTSLKLLLVFVEYSDSNSRLLHDAVCMEDAQKATLPWFNIVNLLKEKDSADMELLVYAVTLINKTLNGFADQDTYYDVVDTLEEQGMEHVIQYYMSKQGTDLDLLQQFQIYEAVLKQEDGVPDTKPLPLDARFRQIPRSRKSICDEIERRKSRRHSVGTETPKNGGPGLIHSRSLENTPEENSWKHEGTPNGVEKKNITNGLNGHMNGNGISETNGHGTLVRKRRDRDARNKSLIKEQEKNGRTKHTEDGHDYQNICSLENLKNNELNNNVEEKKILNGRPSSLLLATGNKKSWMLSMMYAANAKNQDEDVTNKSSSDQESVTNNNYLSYDSKLSDESANLNNNNLRKEGVVKDIQDKFIYRNGDLRSPTPPDRVGDQSGIISRAKEGLAASKSSSTTPNRTTTPSPLLSPSNSFIIQQKLDGDVQWDQLVKSVRRPLVINDLDFTDLKSEEDVDLMQEICPNPVGEEPGGIVPPPPLPLGLGPPPPPPPLPLGGGPVPPPPPPMTNSMTPKQNGTPPTWAKRNQLYQQEKESKDAARGKTKRTVKLFWREVREDRGLLSRIGRKKTIWDELTPVPVDAQKLEHLFENRAKEMPNKKGGDPVGKKSALIVLDTKRSNAINIAMTKLPPPRTIRTAILKMDATIINREGVEKVLGLLPTEDEKARIAEAQMSAPSDVPLGTAEQFLLTLASVSEVEARLRLWAFKLDYDTMEREVAEPMMDLKQAMHEIECSDTFRVVLSTLRAVGNFLNGVEIKGFHIEYLSKVPEVRDTVQKHSLLHHLCHIVMDRFPASTDLYSEIGAVTRASKVDYVEVSKSLHRMESECKASWDYLKAILKHDCNITLKVRTTEFLTDCAERIIVLKVIHRRMINRYHKFLAYLGCLGQSSDDMPVHRCFRLLSEFALEYRTTRERVLQQKQKKANHRERNKTRGKMITDMERFKTKEQQADHELRQLLGGATTHPDEHKTQKWGTVPGTRGRIRPQLGPGGSLGRHSAPVKTTSGGGDDADDDILESLVKTAAAQPARNAVIRKRARHGDRKSLRRTLKSGLELSEEERRILTTLTT
ncbi:hypothetical protein JTE90_007933 [Oedothorax gibbosus]|uniref:FH1/FH2 domain-containing protein 3 n=1 Tax=Oedothorax gibbosus TaxID=931172 RepID=A0AAV6VJ85_9ARAC|nr:hypothetical protein JTE90_007933 [Oedothorax gibbosus]